MLVRKIDNNWTAQTVVDNFKILTQYRNKRIVTIIYKQLLKELIFHEGCNTLSHVASSHYLILTTLRKDHEN